MNEFETVLDLDRVRGGAADDDPLKAFLPKAKPPPPVYVPPGAPVWRAEPPGDRRSIDERLDKAWDDAMGPWERFNNMFGGARAPRARYKPF